MSLETKGRSDGVGPLEQIQNLINSLNQCGVAWEARKNPRFFMRIDVASTKALPVLFSFAVLGGNESELKLFDMLMRKFSLEASPYTDDVYYLPLA